MLEPWNDPSLLPPPVNTFLCKQKLDFKELTYSTNNIIEILSRQSPLHKEAAILSRFLYKFDKKFRNDMGYHYKLPNDLEEWLDMKNLNSLGSFEWTCKIKINIEAIAMEDDSGDLCENILDYVSQINENIDNSDEHEIKLPSIKETFHSEEVHLKQTDLGIAVSRNTLGKSTDEPLSNEHKAAVHTIDTVTNINSLKDFINKEENLRNESNDNALTSHLSFMQWQALKTCLLNLDTNKTIPRKLQRKFKRIWQEKCLDYK
ncbi:unnamed protein product [Colias eurytheme]|nr:unnamed protein product [Colias eurytheme]